MCIRRRWQASGPHLGEVEDAIDVHRDLDVTVHAIPLQVVVLVDIQAVAIVGHNLPATQHGYCTNM